jgi:hypothetical protein
LIGPLIGLFCKEILEPSIGREIISILSIFARKERECFNLIWNTSSELILKCLQFSNTHEIGLDFLAALLCSINECQINSAFYEAFLHVIADWSCLDFSILQPVYPLIAFFSRNGYASVLLSWYLEVLRSDLPLTCIGTVLIWLFLKGTDEEGCRLVQGLLMKLGESKLRRKVKSGLMAGLSAMMIMDYDRVSGFFAALDVELGHMLQVFADLLDFQCICHFDKKLMLTALFRMKGLRGIVYESEMEVGELAFHQLRHFVAGILQDEKEIGLYGINAVERKMCDEMEAFEGDDPFLQGNFIRKMPFSEFVMTIIDGLAIPDDFAPVLLELSDGK